MDMTEPRRRVGPDEKGRILSVRDSGVDSQGRPLSEVWWYRTGHGRMELDSLEERVPGDFNEVLKRRLKNTEHRLLPGNAHTAAAFIRERR